MDSENTSKKRGFRILPLLFFALSGSSAYSYYKYGTIDPLLDKGAQIVNKALSGKPELQAKFNQVVNKLREAGKMSAAQRRNKIDGEEKTDPKQAVKDFNKKIANYQKELEAIANSEDGPSGRAPASK